MTHHTWLKDAAHVGNLSDTMDVLLVKLHLGAVKICENCTKIGKISRKIVQDRQ